MKIRRFFSAYRILFLMPIIVFSMTPNIWGQDDLDTKIINQQAQITDAINRMNGIINQGDEDIEQIHRRLENIKKALHASMTPDNRTVGVYLSIGKDNELSPQTWMSTIEKYFKAYGFPVKIIVDHNQPEGKGAIAVIYIGAKAYEGNLSSGSVSLHYLLTEHKKVFNELLEMYKVANPNLFTTKE